MDNKMDTEKDNILNFFYCNLETISKIKDGYKLYFDKENNIKLEEPYMFQGIWRYCYSVSRKDAIYYINKLINDIEIYFNVLYVKSIDNRLQGKTFNKQPRFKETDIVEIRKIIFKLNDAIHGIGNLVLTYKEDNETCDELNKIMQKIRSLINLFSKMILFENK